jgi:hypothetical protein
MTQAREARCVRTEAVCDGVDLLLEVVKEVLVDVL